MRGTQLPFAAYKPTFGPAPILCISVLINSFLYSHRRNMRKSSHNYELLSGQSDDDASICSDKSSYIRRLSGRKLTSPWICLLLSFLFNCVLIVPAARYVHGRLHCQRGSDTTTPYGEYCRTKVLINVVLYTYISP